MGFNSGFKGLTPFSWFKTILTMKTGAAGSSYLLLCRMVHNQQDYKLKSQLLYICHSLQVTDFLLFIFLVKREIVSVRCTMACHQERKICTAC